MTDAQLSRVLETYSAMTYGMRLHMGAHLRHRTVVTAHLVQAFAHEPSAQAFASAMVQAGHVDPFAHVTPGVGLEEKRP